MKTLKELKEVADGKVSKKRSPESFYGCCLSLRGPGHDTKRCSESMKAENALKMAIIDGKPTTFGEKKIASSVIRAQKASPNGTFRLAIPKAGACLPVTVGVEKPESTMKFSADDIWEFQVKKNLPNDTTKDIVKFLSKIK